MFRNWYNWVDVCVHYDETKNKTYLIQCRTKTNGVKRFRHVLIIRNKLSHDNVDVIMSTEKK